MFSLVSKIIPECWWFVDRMTIVLLKFNDGGLSLFKSPRKITSWVCLLGSGLTHIFHRSTLLLIFFRTSFKFFADKVVSSTTQEREVSSAKSLEFETKLSERSLINFKKKRTKHWSLSYSCFNILPWKTLTI